MSDSRHPHPSSSTDPRRAPAAGRQARLREESGQSLVEFVLVLPLLLLLLFSILDFGKAMNYWVDEGHMASQGARLAAVNSVPSSGTLQAYIKSQGITNEMQNGGGTSLSSALQVCISFPTNTQTGTSAKIGDPVKVTISGTYKWMTYLAGQSGVASSTIAASAVERLEALPTTYSAGCA